MISLDDLRPAASEIMSTQPEGDFFKRQARWAVPMLAAIPPTADERALDMLRTLVFRGAGVDAGTVRELIAVYDGLVDELLRYADTILTAAPEDRARVTVDDMKILEHTRSVLAAQKTKRVPPEPFLLRAAARRLAGVVPPEIPPLGSFPAGERAVLIAYFRGQVLLDERNTTFLA